MSCYSSFCLFSFIFILLSYHLGGTWYPLEMLKEEHEGNWPGITVTVSMSHALEARSCCIGAGGAALRLEEKQSLRSMFGGSAKLAVQRVAVES